MKITAVDTCVLTVPTPPARWRCSSRTTSSWSREIATDEGVRGLGYSLVFNGGGAEAVHAYLETRLKPALIGEDPLYVERLWEKMFRVDMGIKKQGVAAYALSALGHRACGTSTGKVAKLPLLQAVGRACRPQCPATAAAAGAKYAEKDLVAEAERYAAQG